MSRSAVQTGHLRSLSHRMPFDRQRDLARKLGARMGHRLHGLTLRRPWPSAFFLDDPAGWLDDNPALGDIGAPEGGYGFEDDEVAVGPKRVENRTNLPPRALLGEFVAIHAGLGYDEVEWPGGIEPPRKAEAPTGIVGIARLVGALDRRMAPSGMRRRAVLVSRREEADAVRRLTYLDRDPWWQGPVGWLLDDVIAIDPVPCRGSLGVWRVPDDETSAVWFGVRRACRDV